MSRNITEVRLLNVPLENDLSHTLYFSNLTEQTEYFTNKTVKTSTEFSYQRKDKIIRFPGDYDSLQVCNYVMYRNAGYSSKWYYAFITKMEFVSDGRTDIHIETDVIQTWMFNYTVKQSFVEREHVSDDTIGMHTIPEGLEKGPFISNSHTKDDNLTHNNLIVYGTTEDADGERVSGKIYGGIYSGLCYHVCESAESMDYMLKSYESRGAIDSINCMFIAPKFLAYPNYASGTLMSSVPESNSPRTYEILIEKWKTLNGYTPKNNKLLTEEYNCLYVSNNNGGGASYGYEYFTNDLSATFEVQGVICPGCSIRLIPKEYKAITNDEEGLNLGKFPICNWNTDVYTNWLTQNSVNNAVNVVTGVGTMIGGVGALATGAGAIAGLGGIVGGAQMITNTLQEKYYHSLQPAQAKGNTNCGDVITSSKTNTFHFYHMTIKKEYAEIIDKYFDVYGYKVNMVKVPNKNHRANYWYTKCINVNIDGVIPAEDMQKIKACYNNGITFWKNPANIQNYSVENGIV